MKYNIKIIVDKNILKDDYKFLVLSNNSFIITINPETNLDFVCSEESIKKKLREERENLILDINQAECKDIKDELKQDLLNIDKLLASDLSIDNSDNIYIGGNPNEIKQLLDNSKVLNNKNIILTTNNNGEKFDICHEVLDPIIKCFNDNENIRLFLKGNNIFTTVNECRETIEAIDKMVEKVKKYNLSPLEQVIYVYDLVRDKIYKKSCFDIGNFADCRNLTPALLGEEIVCVGYSFIFITILRNLGINCEEVSLNDINNPRKGHSRVVAYINDDKYNIEGIFFFDPTWESKKDLDDQSYLREYSFFCKNFDQIEGGTKNEYLNLFYDGNIYNIDDELIRGNLKVLKPSVCRELNNISNLVDNRSLVWERVNELIDLGASEGTIFGLYNGLTRNDIINCIQRYKQLLEVILPSEVKAQILHKIRKIEYYENSLKYPFDEELFRKILPKTIDSDSNDPYDRLIKCIFPEIYDFDVDEFLEEMNIEKEKSELRLVKTLKQIATEKNKN